MLSNEAQHHQSPASFQSALALSLSLCCTHLGFEGSTGLNSKQQHILDHCIFFFNYASEHLVQRVQAPGVDDNLMNPFLVYFLDDFSMVVWVSRYVLKSSALTWNIKMSDSSKVDYGELLQGLLFLPRRTQLTLISRLLFVF